MEHTLPYIPFHRPLITGREKDYVLQALQKGRASSCGAFSAACERWLEEKTGAPRVLLTHSCTNALEMAAVLFNIQPGDEVIMPAFTFTSTANAFALRGAVPVFVDIREDTLNIDERLIEEAITSRTRAIVPVHYAGASCEMDSIMAIADKHELLVVEDSAQCLGATYNGRALGTIGHLGVYSFHETKNIQCGQGGALLINDRQYVERAEILHDKGTTRAQYRAGKVKQYSWVDFGMSAPASELQAAFLLAQLEVFNDINLKRKALWENYYDNLHDAEQARIIRRPAGALPNGTHNAHIFAIRLSCQHHRDRMAQYLDNNGIGTALHYEPLHISLAGKRLSRINRPLINSENVAKQILRLPMWHGMPEGTSKRITRLITEFSNNNPAKAGLDAT